jgi:hypothetical protein
MQREKQAAHRQQKEALGVRGAEEIGERIARQEPRRVGRGLAIGERAREPDEQDHRPRERGDRDEPCRRERMHGEETADETDGQRERRKEHDVLLTEGIAVPGVSGPGDVGVADRVPPRQQVHPRTVVVLGSEIGFERNGSDGEKSDHDDRQPRHEQQLQHRRQLAADPCDLQPLPRARRDRRSGMQHVPSDDDDGGPDRDSQRGRDRDADAGNLEPHAVARGQQHRETQQRDGKGIDGPHPARHDRSCVGRRLRCRINAHRV